MESWKERLHEELAAAISRAGSMRALSASMGRGDNYIQQLTRNGKSGIMLPTFIKMLEVLGSSSAIYILFGTRLDDPKTQEIIDVVSRIDDPQMKRVALDQLRALQQSALSSQSPRTDPQDPDD